jgi:hypothetical protein
MQPSADACKAGDTIAYWCHVDSPLDLSEVRAVILEGLAAAKADHLEALAAHDYVKADRLRREVVGLNFLAAKFAEGIALSRARYLAPDRAWPLGSRAW